MTKKTTETKQPSRRGIHTKQGQGESIQWVTPEWIFKGLGGYKKFNLDPCAMPDAPWPTARKMVKPPIDGLKVKWKGLVWLNPPSGGMNTSRAWLQKLAEHNNGIALVAARTEVEKWFFPYGWETASAMLFIRGRVWYRKPDGTIGNSNAGHGSVLMAYGKRAAKILGESSIAGQYINFIDQETFIIPGKNPK